MSSHSINRIIENLASVQREPAISIQTYRKVSDGLYTVAFSVERDDYSGEVLGTAFSKVFAGAFSVVPSTMLKIHNKHHHLYTAVAMANTQNHMFTDETVAKLGLTLTTANVFVDEQDNVWKAVGDGDNKRIVLTSTDDYDKILGARRSRNLITAALTTNMSLNMGDYVMFYDPRSQALDFGYAVNANTVFSKSSQTMVQVIAELVLEVAAVGSMDVNPLIINSKEVMASTKTGTAAFLEYWSKLYNKPETLGFYKALETLMKKSTIN